MMRMLLPTLVLSALAAVATTPVSAQDSTSFTFAGDQYAAGQQSDVTNAVPGDAFAAGFNVKVDAPVGGSAHLAGYSVAVNAAVTGDLYAAGFNVDAGAPIKGDATAAGNAITLHAPVGGNVRFAGANVRVAGDVTGSALISADTLTLAAPVTGDLSFYGRNIVFENGAKVNGTLAVHAPEPVTVPVNVAAADHVTYQVLANSDYGSQASQAAQGVVRGFWPAFWGTALWGLFLVVIGAAFITLLWRQTVALEEASKRRQLPLFGSGIVSFAAAIGIIPLAAITIIGLVTVPFLIVAIAVACSLAYVLGSYLVGLRIARSFTQIDNNLKRIGVLAASVIVAMLIGALPFLGWLVTLILVTYGFGAFTISIVDRRATAILAEPASGATMTPATSRS